MSFSILNAFINSKFIKIKFYLNDIRVMQLVYYDYNVSFLFVCLFVLLSFHAQGQMLPQKICRVTTPALPALWFNGEKFQQLIKMVLY